MSKMIDFYDLPLRRPGDFDPRPIGSLTPLGIMRLTGIVPARYWYSMDARLIGELEEGLIINAEASCTAFSGPAQNELSTYLDNYYDVRDDRHCLTLSLDIRRDIQRGSLQQQPRSPEWHTDDTAAFNNCLMFIIGSKRPCFNMQYRRKNLTPQCSENIGQIGRYEILEMTWGTPHRSSPHFREIEGNWEFVRAATYLSLKPPAIL